MKLLSLLSYIASTKQQKADIKPNRTLVPLGLTQGALVELPELDLIMAEAGGALFNAKIQKNQSVIAVGKYYINGLDGYNSYLSDSKTYVQLVCTSNTSNVLEAKVFSSHDEILPQSAEDWEFWLGSFQKDSITGEYVRDSAGKALVKEPGLIGSPLFQVDTTPPVVYNRLYSANVDSDIAPMNITERVYSLDANGTQDIITVGRDYMDYYRRLPDDNAITEFLQVAVNQSDDDAAVNIFIGLSIVPTDLKIITPQ